MFIEPPISMVNLLISGTAATATMDVLTTIARRLGFANGAKGAWVGRWYLGMFHGRFAHVDITSLPEHRGEKAVAMAGHYAIGIVLAIAYVYGCWWLGLSPRSFLAATGFSTSTVVFPLFVVYPALGFGCCGSRSSDLKPLQTSFLSHFFYGIGLWWGILVVMK
ncbi:MAG: hypothetical protein C0600_02895 [Ignavibacteria bacterium]|nr:MAG: hypothetical protein C0600_02895 [Ignavibacteria bacterium]